MISELAGVAAEAKEVSKELKDIKKEISESFDFDKLIDKNVDQFPQELSDDIKQKLKDSGMSEGTIRDARQIGDHIELKTPIPEEFKNQYVRKTLDIAGQKVEGYFPKFDSKFTATLPESKLLAKDAVQMKECTQQLKEAIENNPELAKNFNSKQLEQIMDGKSKIPGYTWHHNEERGVMELVDSKTHTILKHLAGRAIWGGGQAYR